MKTITYNPRNASVRALVEYGLHAGWFFCGDTPAKQKIVKAQDVWRDENGHPKWLHDKIQQTIDDLHAGKTIVIADPNR